MHAGDCVAMADRRQPILEDEMGINRDTWFDPAVGTIDNTVVVETDLQSQFPSMCS